MNKQKSIKAKPGDYKTVAKNKHKHKFKYFVFAVNDKKWQDIYAVIIK